jgi:transposase-like protein
MISLHNQRYNMRERDMAISFKGAHFPPEVILMGVRWYVAYPLSTRHVEELMEERGVHVDHSTINRWVIKYSPQLPAFCAMKEDSHYG